MRTQWTDLPPGIRRTIEARTGAITTARDIPYGITRDLAAAVETRAGMFFVKGVHDSSGRRAQSAEAAVNLRVRGISPVLRWRISASELLFHPNPADAREWDFLIFDFVPGRHADLAPGSPNLPRVADLLNRASICAGPRDTLPCYSERWAPWLEEPQLELLRGQWLLHTNTSADHILIGEDSEWLVDWAKPARGPAWVDTAYTAVRLIAAGHDPAQALAWAATVPAWGLVTPQALDAFVTAHCAEWTAVFDEEGAAVYTDPFRRLLEPVAAT